MVTAMNPSRTRHVDGLANRVDSRVAPNPSVANHTVLVHGVRAAELRLLADLPAKAPLCSPGLSDRHRELAIEGRTTDRLHQPQVYRAAAATRTDARAAGEAQL